MKKKTRSEEGGLVYSTDPDLDLNAFEEDSEGETGTKKQNLRIWLQRLKADKKATVIKGFEGSDTALEELARSLRQQCSCGGTVKDGEIILQGDVREKAGKVLSRLGHTFKLAGG